MGFSLRNKECRPLQDDDGFETLLHPYVSATGGSEIAFAMITKMRKITQTSGNAQMHEMTVGLSSAFPFSQVRLLE